jgi:hypothetical protein
VATIDVVDVFPCVPEIATAYGFNVINSASISAWGNDRNSLLFRERYLWIVRTDSGRVDDDLRVADIFSVMPLIDLPAPVVRACPYSSTS